VFEQEILSAWKAEPFVLWLLVLLWSKGVWRMASQKLSVVLNPEAQRTPATEGSGAGTSSWSMAPRLDNLNGKTVYLVNQGFGGSDLFMEQLGAWFAENMPTVKTVLKRKTGFIFRDDTTDLWKEIKEKGNAVIFGVAG
jgi:hypothetical protein